MHLPSAFKAALAAGALLTGALALAQTVPATGPAPSRDAPTHDRHNQRVQHIQLEDAGSRVDEVRVGGETRSITVQPKVAMPAYDVRPADASAAASPEAGPGSSGPRVWKLLRF